MPVQRKELLFVSHRATLSGAPILLAEIIREFSRQSDIPFRIIVLDDGPLLNEFRRLGKTYLWKKRIIPHDASWAKNHFGLLLSILINKIYQYLRAGYILFSVRRSSLIFFNTVASGRLDNQLHSLKCRRIYYVHELEAAIHMCIGDGSHQRIFNNANTYFAVSAAVKNNLVCNHNIRDSNIRIFHASVKKSGQDKKAYQSFVESFKMERQISAGSTLIGVMGSNEWRKGFDLFLPLALVYFNLYPEDNVYFVWKGFKQDNPSSFFDRYDMEKFKVDGRVILLPHGSGNLEYMACFDIHLLLSREDPYPLVIQEAASLGIPTIAFADAGGSAEFIGQDSGICVPYGDLVKMATAIHRLVNDPVLTQNLGEAARQKVLLRHNPGMIIGNLIDAIVKLSPLSES